MRVFTYNDCVTIFIMAIVKWRVLHMKSGVFTLEVFKKLISWWWARLFVRLGRSWSMYVIVIIMMGPKVQNAKS